MPFAISAREVAFGMLISELSTTGTGTTRPTDHVVSFADGIPCDQQGNQLTKIINSIGEQHLADGLTADCRFSSKPPDGYPDYHAKMAAYANMVSGFAQIIDPAVSARSLMPVTMTEDQLVFRYLDSGSSRARITLITGRLALPRVAKVGLGGTGGYVLDLIAKTPVGEIHLYDGDIFAQRVPPARLMHGPTAKLLQDGRATTAVGPSTSPRAPLRTCPRSRLEQTRGRADSYYGCHLW